MSTLLVHLTVGPEAPTRAALAFLVARAAMDDGHQVSLFLAGDGVQLYRPATTDALHGVGTGSLREHLDALVAGGATFYASGLSSKARALTVEDMGGVPVQMATPNQLVQLVLDHDRVITYCRRGDDRPQRADQPRRRVVITRPQAIYGRERLCRARPPVGSALPPVRVGDVLQVGPIHLHRVHVGVAGGSMPGSVTRGDPLSVRGERTGLPLPGP